jgi:AcrR family transcriptional regulator
MRSALGAGLLGYAASVGDRAIAGQEPGGYRADPAPPAPRRPRRAQRNRRRLSVDERRDELIAAALDLFSSRPPESVSIDDVAEAAGASRALVYHYFGGKQELYVAALQSAASQLSNLLEPPTEGKPLDKLTGSLHRYFDFVEDHAAGYVALLRGGPADRSGEVGEIIDGIRQLLLKRIMHSVGVAEPGPVLRLTMRSWLASVETAGLDWLERRDLPREQLEKLLVDQLIVLMHVAGRYDSQVADLFDQLASEELG